MTQITATGNLPSKSCNNSPTTDQILNFEGDTPQEVTVADKKGIEQVNLINQLDEDDKTTVFKIIDTMLTKKNSKTSSRKV